MPSKLTLLCALGLSALPLLPTKAQDQQPYDLRGIRLGLTLGELRKFPFPDVEKRAQHQLVCTPDRDARKTIKGNSFELVVPPDFAKIGVIVCRYYLRSGAILTASGFDFAGTGTRAVTFRLAPPDAGTKEPTLFNINIEITNALFENVVMAFSEKYGKPSRSTPSTIQNRMGGSFSNVKTTWTNGVSTIDIDRISQRVDTMAINYYHNPLTAEVNRRTDDLMKAGAKKL